jgi:hypothetical protein
MKKEIAQYVAWCDTCQRTKAEHQKPAGLLQPLQVPKWKWEQIGMDYVIGLPRTQKGNDSIWVIIDRLTKVAHFIPVKTTFGGTTLDRIYLKEIVRLHGIPRKIVSDRGTQFCWAEIPPPPRAQLSRTLFPFLLFLLLFSYINAYIDILCTKSSLNKL